MFYVILLIFLILSSMDFIPNNIKVIKIKKIIFFIVIIFLSCIEGLRNETGTDWMPYQDQFYNSNYYIYISNFEKGYLYIVDFFKEYISKDYNIFLFILTLFKNIVTYTIIFNLSEYSFLTIALYYSLTLGIMGANRQLIALSFSAYSLKKIFDKRYCQSIISFLLGFLFHKSIILIFPIYFYNYFLRKNKLTKKNLIKKLLILSVLLIVLKVSMFIFLPKILILSMKIFKSSIDKIIIYSQVKQAGFYNYIFGLIKNLILLIIISISLNNFQNKKGYIQSKLDFLLKGYFYGLILYTLFYGQFQILVARGSFYTLAYFSAILLGYIVVNQKNNYIKIGVYIFLILYTVFSFEKSIVGYKELFVPYKSIFYNKNFRRTLY